MASRQSAVLPLFAPNEQAAISRVERTPAANVGHDSSTTRPADMPDIQGRDTYYKRFIVDFSNPYTRGFN